MERRGSGWAAPPVSPERADCVWAREVEMALGLTCAARGHEVGRGGGATSRMIRHGEGRGALLGKTQLWKFGAWRPGRASEHLWKELPASIEDSMGGHVQDWALPLILRMS